MRRRAFYWIQIERTKYHFRPSSGWKDNRVAHLDESLSYAQKRTGSGVPHLLLGAELELETPALAELTAATAALAIGAKRKAL